MSLRDRKRSVDLHLSEQSGDEVVRQGRLKWHGHVELKSGDDSIYGPVTGFEEGPFYIWGTLYRGFPIYGDVMKIYEGSEKIDNGKAIAWAADLWSLFAGQLSIDSSLTRI